MKLTYKSLFGYSLIIVALLVLAVPVFANSSSGSHLLDFSRSDNTGHSIQSAQQLSKGINISHLTPGQEIWYAFSRTSFNDPGFSWVSLALRYESEAQISTEQVNFEVLAQNQSNAWFQAETTDDILGGGMVSPLRASTQNLVETFWTGHVAEQENYFVRVYNNSPFSLDYTLEVKAEQPAVSGAMPASYNSNSGNAVPLNIRQTAWTLTAQAVENMDATQAANWMQKAQSIGWIVTEGTDVPEIPNPAEANPQTLWQLTAEAIEGQDAASASQWLIQADSMGWLAIPMNTVKPPLEDVTEDTGGGGEGESEPPAMPIQPEEIYAPVNIYPNNPIPFNLNQLNSGRLAPYGEHWYELTRDDLDNDLFEDIEMTMFFTPIQGFLSNRINFEIFPAGQYHIWTRGDADYMENLGAGTWVSRDEDPHTGERLWSGSLVDGDRYLVKIKNGTPEEVDYYLFPNDVENAELGNPTLHKGDATAGRVPYAPSPPTRSGPPPKPGDGPPEAISLEIGATTGALNAGKEIWYQFSFNDSHNGTTPEHDFKFYLTNTPLNNIRARHAEFEIYPGNQLHLWTRGTIDQLKPLGAGADALYPAGDKKSMKLVWDGQLMEDHLYYVRIHNYDIGPLEYELKITGGP